MQRNRQERLVILTLKRLLVWLLEASCATFLLGLFLIVVWVGPDKDGFARGLRLFVSGIILLSFTSGYDLTTMVFRIVWKRRRLQLYPIVATSLFLAHSQVIFIYGSGATPSERWLLRASGVCIVFACTFAGSYVLRRWEQPGNEEVGALNSM